MRDRRFGLAAHGSHPISQTQQEKRNLSARMHVLIQAGDGILAHVAIPVTAGETEQQGRGSRIADEGVDLHGLQLVPARITADRAVVGVA